MWGFQFLLILDLWGISFHAVVVFGPGKNLLFKSILGRCALSLLCFGVFGRNLEILTLVGSRKLVHYLIEWLRMRKLGHL